MDPIIKMILPKKSEKYDRKKLLLWELIADEVKIFVSFIKYTCYNRTILNSKQGGMQYEQYFSQNQCKKIWRQTSGKGKNYGDPEGGNAGTKCM